MLIIFTGIIEEVGEIKKVEVTSDSRVFTIKCHQVLEGTKIGDSIATNGVCLTVTSMSNDHFCADVMNETLKVSTLSDFKNGARVNLERALKVGDRLGGHMVSGHVDGVGNLKSKTKVGNAFILVFKAPRHVCDYIIKKGSITIEGISLTVVDVKLEEFSVSIIPHTLEETNLGLKILGDQVNLECDLVGKYIEKFMKKEEPKITGEFLKTNGFW